MLTHDQLFRNMAGYSDHVRNTVINYVSATEDDVAICYLYACADVQQANLEHSYCHLPMLQHQVDRALVVTEQDAAKLEACTRAQSRSTVWHSERAWRLLHHLSVRYVDVLRRRLASISASTLLAHLYSQIEQLYCWVTVIVAVIV